MTSSVDFRFSCSGRGYIISISLVQRTYTSKQAVCVVAHVCGGTLLPAPRSFAFTAATGWIIDPSAWSVDQIWWSSGPTRYGG